MRNYEIKKVGLALLKQHEMIIGCHLAKLMGEMEDDGFISDPVIVDRDTMVILDGHHRFNILKKLGLRLCPVCLVDYKNDAAITVDCWRDGEKITKEEVLSAGLSGKLLEPKTSKHNIPNRPVSMRFAFDELR
jgi:hypothetical protein